jgi:hypothetical protein
MNDVIDQAEVAVNEVVPRSGLMAKAALQQAPVDGG